MTELHRYLAAERGRLPRLAEKLGLRREFVWQWANELRSIPVRYCPAVERETGVARWHLRPNDWAAIWPELVGAEGAPDAPAAKEAA